MKSIETQRYRRSVKTDILLPLAAFLLLSFTALHPLVLHLSHKSMPGQGDKYIFLWNLWWVEHSLSTPGQPLFYTDLLFSPLGTSLAFHTLTPANGLIGILLGSQLNTLLAHNLLFLLSFVLGGWFTFLMVRELGGSPSAGLLAGIIFSFAHPNWRYVFMCQMNLVCCQWIPLFLLLVLLLLKNGRRRTGLGIGLAAALIFYTSLQQVLFTLLLVPPLVIHGLLLHRPRGSAVRPFLTGMGIALVTAGLLAAPLLVEMGKSADESRITGNLDQVAQRATRLENVLYDHATGRRFWNAWSDSGLAGPACRFFDRAVPRRGPLFGYGASLILLSGLGFVLADRHTRRPALIWVVVSIALLWLMLGPHPKPFGQRIPSLHLFLFGLPGFSAIRFPSRFVIPLALAVAILVGLSWTALSRCVLQGHRPWARISVTFMVVLFPFAEYFRAPFRLIDLHQPPAIYSNLVNYSDQGGSVLELPFWASGAYFLIGRQRYETTWFQTVHQQPRVGGHVSRAGADKGNALRRNRALLYLSDPNILGRPEPEQQAFRELVEEYRVRIINVDRTRYRPADEKALKLLLEQRLGAVLIAREKKYLTYRIPGRFFIPSAEDSWTIH